MSHTGGNKKEQKYKVGTIQPTVVCTIKLTEEYTIKPKGECTIQATGRPTCPTGWLPLFALYVCISAHSRRLPSFWTWDLDMESDRDLSRIFYMTSFQLEGTRARALILNHFQWQGIEEDLLDNIMLLTGTWVFHIRICQLIGTFHETGTGAIYIM